MQTDVFWYYYVMTALRLNTKKKMQTDIISVLFRFDSIPPKYKFNVNCKKTLFRYYFSLTEFPQIQV